MNNKCKKRKKILFFKLLLDILKIMRYCLCEMEVNNIAVKLEKIRFNKDTTEELNKFAKTYKMKVTYYYGYIVEFKKTNVYAISPHKIVFTKYGYNVLVLYYDDYHANENLFFISEEKEPFTIGSLKRYIKEYFSIIYKMNLK